MKERELIRLPLGNYQLRRKDKLYSLTKEIADSIYGKSHLYTIREWGKLNCGMIYLEEITRFPFNTNDLYPYKGLTAFAFVGDIYVQPNKDPRAFCRSILDLEFFPRSSFTEHIKRTAHL